MILKVQLGDQLLELNVPEGFLQQAEDFFAGMDRDMDRGWQVNREWVDAPDTGLRALIAADKLLTALENEDHRLGRLMAGYIVSRLPDISLLELNPMGEVRDHLVHRAQAAAPADDAFGHGGVPAGLDKMQAMAQAGKDVSKVFRMGRQYRFTVYDHATGQWDESPAFGSMEDAEKQRELTFRARFEALCTTS